VAVTSYPNKSAVSDFWKTLLKVEHHKNVSIRDVYTQDV